MSDINYLEQLLPKVRKTADDEQIDWQALLERDTGCPYDEQDYSPAQIRMSLKANPTEIDTTNDTERAERKRKFRSRGESRLTPPPTWLIDELIMEESHVGIYAPSQFLKSFTAIDLAGALATRRQALGCLPWPVVARSSNPLLGSAALFPLPKTKKAVLIHSSAQIQSPESAHLREDRRAGSI